MKKSVAKTAGVRKGAVKSKTAAHGEAVEILASFTTFERKKTELCHEAYLHEKSDDPKFSTLELLGPTVTGQQISVGAFNVTRWTGLNGDADGKLYEEGFAVLAGNGDPVRRPCSDAEARAFLLARSPLLARLFGSSITLTPENAAVLKQAADFFGNGETPDNLVNQFHVGGYATPLDIVEMVIGGNDRPALENRALLAKARAHFGEEP